MKNQLTKSEYLDIVISKATDQLMTKNWFGDKIFVFGSNLAGRHGAGAAKFARNNYGAVYGFGHGRTGQAYALPTKDKDLNVFSLEIIELNVKTFLEYARRNPDLNFLVTRIGCGLAGYKDEQITPFFRLSPINCKLPEEWTRLYQNPNV